MYRLSSIKSRAMWLCFNPYIPSCRFRVHRTPSPIVEPLSRLSNPSRGCQTHFAVVNLPSQLSNPSGCHKNPLAVVGYPGCGRTCLAVVSGCGRTRLHVVISRRPSIRCSPNIAVHPYTCWVPHVLAWLVQSGEVLADCCGIRHAGVMPPSSPFITWHHIALIVVLYGGHIALIVVRFIGVVLFSSLFITLASRPCRYLPCGLGFPHC